MNLVKKFCNNGVSDETIYSTLDALGVEVISDLGVIDLQTSFGDIMKPVQLGKFRKEYDRIANLRPEKSSSPQHHHLNYSKIFSEAMMGLSKCDYLTISREVGDKLYMMHKTVSLRYCKKIADDMHAKFSAALTIQSLKGTELLSNVIYRRIKYRKRLDLKKKESSNLSSTLELRKFSKRQDYAIATDRDLPLSFPGEETKATQESKRLEMIAADSSGEVNWKKVSQLMKETYVAQRLSIHYKQNAGEVIKDWPFLGKFSILRHYFNVLMNTTPGTVEERLEKLGQQFLKFFKADVMKPRREGPAKEVAGKIKQCLIKYDKCAVTANTEFSTLTLCVALKLDQDLNHLIIFFCERTSYDEVQASNKLPKDGRPIIAVLGEDLLDTPQCFVLVDNCIISKTPVPPVKALLSVFMCYFIFKVTYPKKLALLFEFIQRAIFEIEGDLKSSRIERRKNSKGNWETNPNGAPLKYLSLMRDFDEYMSTWTDD